MSTELARRHDELPSTQVAEAITSALESLRAIRTFIKSEFKEGTDYGLIPGCGPKPTLFLPGAQKASMYYNSYPTYKVRPQELLNGHVEYRVRCLLISRNTGNQVGEGIGCCSTMETKYRYRKAERLCPKCGQPAIINGKAEYGGGYVCFHKKGGCGAKYNKGDRSIESQPQGNAENPDIHDVHNTVLKMAKKRAHVDAAMTLGCLSELFTQDIEDIYPMVEVREVARPAVEVIDGHQVIEGEIVEAGPPKPSPTGKGSGMFSKEHVKATADFNAWISRQCATINDKWKGEWDERLARAMADGMNVPSKLEDVINPWQAKNHLLKWAIEDERLDPSIVPEEARTRQADALVAFVFYRSQEDKAAVIAEMGRYLQDQRRKKSNAIYRKHPDLAPAGWAEEQAEANAQASEEIDRGDAYEEPCVEEMMARTGVGSGDPAEDGKDS